MKIFVVIVVGFVKMWINLDCVTCDIFVEKYDKKDVGRCEKI